MIELELHSEFRRATPRDVPAIVALTNAANAGDGDGSWTHEANLFAGKRTDEEEILAKMAAGAVFILRIEGRQVVGSFYIEPLRTSSYLGLLAVHPALQKRGVGKQLLAEGERIARDDWGCKSMMITVLAEHRPELAAFYQRRGYARTGRGHALLRRNAHTAKVPGLTAEWMEKRFS
jgi:GNAT superfamily N-acetyltransferase